MTVRGLVLAVVAAVAASALTALVYGSHAAWVTLAILLPLGAAGALATGLLEARSRSVGPLSRQFALAVLIGVVPLALAAWLFLDQMFVSHHDAFFAALLVAYAGLLACWAAWSLWRRAARDLERIRGVLTAVGEGRRDVRGELPGRDELAALGADVDEMVTRLDNEERARRSLIAGVSHDLRTPITSLQLLAEGLADDIFEPGQQRAALARMTTHVRALGALIDDLFELSRLEAGDIRWSLERVELDALIAETVEAMRPSAEAGAIRMQTEVPGALAPARANPEQLQRVLFNLIQNAIRHTPPDGTIVVRAAPLSDQLLQLEVADDGEGIADDDRGRVFEAFVGGDVRGGGAAGLGLAIARAIVEAHGGRIWLGPAPAGTQVRFTVPVAGSGVVAVPGTLRA